MAAFVLIGVLIGMVFLAAPGQAKLPEVLDVTPSPILSLTVIRLRFISARLATWRS